MSKESILIKLQGDADADPPKEFRIFGAGVVRTRKGEFLFDESAAKAVMAAAEEFADFALDYGHSHFNPSGADPADQHAAAGWFKPELRKGELWATDVRWTPKAEKKLRDKEFKFISPTFRSEFAEVEGKKVRRVEELLNVALTNVPATRGLKPLVLNAEHEEVPGHAQNGESTMTTPQLTTQFIALAITLGLEKDASEAEIVAQAARDHGEIQGIVRLTGADDVRGALSVLSAWKKDHERVTKLEAEMAEIREKERKSRVELAVTKKIDAGYLEPGKKETTIKLGMQLSEELFKEHLDGLNVQISRRGGPVRREEMLATPRGAENANAEPTIEELQVCGYASIEEYRKDAAKLAGKGDWA